MQRCATTAVYLIGTEDPITQVAVRVVSAWFRLLGWLGGIPVATRDAWTKIHERVVLDGKSLWRRVTGPFAP